MLILALAKPDGRTRPLTLGETGPWGTGSSQKSEHKMLIYKVFFRIDWLSLATGATGRATHRGALPQ